MKKLIGIALILVLLIALVVPAQAEAAEGKTLRIIATSDLHGKFMPWDYALNAESLSGSMVQLATAIAQYRDDNTLLVDAGDTIQDNYADVFVGKQEIHPMIQAINALNYDVVVTGNHEYNYGMDVHGEIGDVRELIRDYIIQVKGSILSPECDNSWKITGNNWDPALHQKAVEMIAAGKLSVPVSEDGKHPNAKAITEDDLMK